MNSITETLEKFNNGEQRYEDDPNFKEAVDSLAAKIGVYAVLDKTLNQLRVLREIHTRTVEQSKQLIDEAKDATTEKDSLFKSVSNLLEGNQKLRDEVTRYEAYALVSRLKP